MGLPARVVAVVVALVVAACGPTVRPIEMTDARVSAGAQRSCGDLGMSDVRCTLVTLRAAKALENLHPDATVTGRELHEAGAPPAGQSPLPGSEVVAAVVVFDLSDGSRIGIPVLCPRESGGSDAACNPLIQ